MARVGFIGLGVMGFPMAGHLAASDNEVVVYNRTKSKVNKWLELYNGTTLDSPGEVAQQSDFVFCCVGNDEDVRSVTLGDSGAFKYMQKGSVFVDHSTVSAMVAKELGQVAIKNEFGFIDAPVSGGQVGAQNGILTVMCGGEESLFAKVQVCS